MMLSTLTPTPLEDPSQFSALLYEKVCSLNRGTAELELYEFQYALHNMTPPGGWQSIQCLEMETLVQLIQQPVFYETIELRPQKDNRISLDAKITWLSQMLWVGLVTGKYPLDWVNRYFYFDLRGFFFLVRTSYFNPVILNHFGSRPFAALKPQQKELEVLQEIGFKEFNAANQAINHAFIAVMRSLITARGTPLLLTIVGPTAAGKTEIVEQLSQQLNLVGKSVTTIEMDNFYKDRTFRDGKPMDENVIHFDLFQRCIQLLLQGKAVDIPRYDFVAATSSHDLAGCIRAGQSMIKVIPADIILLEGNFPFHIPQIAPFIGIKVVYLTDDPIRLKRKWKRDVDFRKKYDPFYLCNRFFRTQMLRAREVYMPMMETCDVVVDTTHASLWLTPEAVTTVRAAQPSDLFNK